MMTMIEKVARKLREMTKANGSKVWGDDESGWRNYVHDAKELLIAMQVSSPAMNNAAFAEGDRLFRGDRDAVEPPMVWNTMIEAAIADNPPAP